MEDSNQLAIYKDYILELKKENEEKDRLISSLRLQLKRADLEKAELQHETTFGSST